MYRIGPGIDSTGDVVNGVTKTTLGDLGRYAAKELPWAAATTAVQEGFNNLSNNKGFLDYDAESFGKSFLENLGQDVGMDAANLAMGKIREKKTYNTQFDNNGNAVKTNPDGTISRLSDEELADTVSSSPLNVLRDIKRKAIDVYDDLTAGQGDFGPIYNRYSGTGQEAVDYIARRQKGEVPSAFTKDGIGDIDVMYGKKGTQPKYDGGYGISKIQAKHGDEAVSKIGQTIKDGKITETIPGKIILDDDASSYRAVINTDWLHKPKNWINTNYYKENASNKASDNPASGGNGFSVSSAKGIFASDGTNDALVNNTISQNPKNVKVEPLISGKDVLNKLGINLENLGLTTKKISTSYDNNAAAERLLNIVTGKMSWNEYLDTQKAMLWQSFKNSNEGVERFPGVYDNWGDGSEMVVKPSTVSLNGELYKQLYNEYGGKPTKQVFMVMRLNPILETHL